MINSISYSESVQAATNNALINRNNPARASESAPTTQPDSVNISEEAYALLQANSAENSAENSQAVGNNLLSIQELVDRLVYMLNNLDEVAEEFQTELKLALRNQGIDLDTPIELSTASDGSVYVVGDHPDKAAIEQYFRDNPDMRDRFEEIQALAEIKAALKLHIEFSEAYEKDPVAAVAKYFPMFNMLKMETYTMTIGGGQDSAAQEA